MQNTQRNPDNSDRRPLPEGWVQHYESSYVANPTMIYFTEANFSIPCTGNNCGTCKSPPIHARACSEQSMKVLRPNKCYSSQSIIHPSSGHKWSNKSEILDDACPWSKSNGTNADATTNAYPRPSSTTTILREELCATVVRELCEQDGRACDKQSPHYESIDIH